MFFDPDTPAILSIFAGRIADTGINPSPIMAECKKLRNINLNLKFSGQYRELFNIFSSRKYWMSNNYNPSRNNK